MKIEITPPFEIKGNGTSLWGNSEGTFFVEHLEVEYNKNQQYGTVSMFGKNFAWNHYTDKLIEEEVIRLLPIISKHVGQQIKRISWSEHGMQPANGWNFDIH